MSIEDLKEEYRKKKDLAEGVFEKNLLDAELNHKIKLLSVSEEADMAIRRDESEFECFGCGS